MQASILKILDKLSVSRQFAERVSDELRTGKLDLYAGASDSPSTAWNFINDACEHICKSREANLSSEQQVDCLLDVVEAYPSYAASQFLFRLFREDGLSSLAEDKLWEGILCLLVNENIFVHEAARYVLWVDFFEDQSCSEEAWLALTSRAKAPHMLDKLLVNAGSVPFMLKRPFYDELLQEPARHAVVAESLARSVNDVYGQIDNRTARGYLQRLHLPEENEHVRYLSETLSFGASLTRHVDRQLPAWERLKTILAIAFRK